MADTETANTKDEVKRLHAEGKSAKEIAEALEKTPATIYNHLRNLGLGHGKRGRPRKSDAEKAETKSAPKATTTRPRPRPGSGPKAESKPAAKATTNGHDSAGVAERFPKIKSAIEDELRDARSKVATLEGMLEAVR